MKTPHGTVYRLNFQDIYLYFTDEGDVIWGNGDTVFDLVYNTGQTNETRDRLYELIHEPCVAVFSSVPLKGYLDQERPINPFLPEYEHIDSGLAALESGTLILRSSQGSHSEFILMGSTDQSVQVVENALSQQSDLLMDWLTRFLEITATRFDSTGPTLAAQQFVDLLKNSSQEIKGRELHWKLDSVDYLSVIRGILEGATEIARKRVGLAQRKSQLGKIGLAIHNYHDQHRSFPFEPIRDASGKALLSWRVRILPYFSVSRFSAPKEIPDFHLDEPWDSEHNRSLLSEIPDAFRDSENTENTKTRYCAPRGPGLASDPDRLVSVKDIKDGTAETIMIFQKDSAHAIEWTRPDESLLNLEDPSSQLDNSQGYCLVLSSDGAIRQVDLRMPPEEWQALLTVAGEESLKPKFVDPFDIGLFSWRELKYYASLEETRQKMQRISDRLIDDDSRRVIPRSNFDTSGKPLLSWRVHILPKLGYSELYDEFRLDEPWDSTHNFRLVEKIPSIFRRRGGPGDGKTNYLVPVGKTTVFEKEGLSVDRIIPSGGGDGFGSVIFLVEVDDEFAVPWTKSVDMEYDPKKPRNFFGKNYPLGFLVAFGNSPSQIVYHEFSNDNLRALFDYKSGKDVSDDDLEIIRDNW